MCTDDGLLVSSFSSQSALPCASPDRILVSQLRRGPLVCLHCSHGEPSLQWMRACDMTTMFKNLHVDKRDMSQRSFLT